MQADRADIVRAISQLPAVQRRAIDLVFYCGYTTEEAAEQMGMHRTQLRRHLGRGVAGIRGSL